MIDPLPRRIDQVSVNLCVGRIFTVFKELEPHIGSIRVRDSLFDSNRDDLWETVEAARIGASLLYCLRSEGQAMKIGKRREPRPTVDDRVQELLDDAAKYRSARLARGNLLIQRGCYATPTEWKKRRADHPERVKRLRRVLEAAR